MTPTQKRGLPKVGQGVRIIVAGDRHPLQITSRIQSVGDDGLICVRPVAASAVADLTKGLAVVLEYFLDEAIYRLSTYVYGLGVGSDANVVQLAPPEGVKKLQHRRFPRLNIQLQAQILVIEVPGGFDKDEKLRHQSLRQWAKQVAKEGAPALTEDLSASGLRLASALPLSEDATVFVHFVLAGKPVNALGLVTWAGHAQTAGFAHAYGVDFVTLEENERKRIAEFVSARAK
jgi:hypothetical protein